MIAIGNVVRRCSIRRTCVSVKGLPAPLRVLGDGTILGKPKAPGVYSLDVAVVDAAGIRNEATVLLRVVRR